MNHQENTELNNQLHSLHEIIEQQRNSLKQLEILYNELKNQLHTKTIIPEFKIIEPEKTIDSTQHIPIEKTPIEKEPIEFKEIKSEEVQTKPNIIKESPSRENLNEKLAKSRKENTAEKMNMSPIADIRKAININQAMAFAKVYFHGDPQKFSDFADELNSFSSKNEAETHIQTHIDPLKNQELYDALLTLINRRYSI